MRRIRRKNSKRGFTLTEILVVMVIAGILLALTLGLYGRVKSKQIESRVLSEMAAIELALENYKAKNGVYPPSLSWAMYDYPLKKWPITPGTGTPDPPNRLYKQLCNNSGGPPFLPDGRNSTDQRDPSDPTDDDNPDVLLSSAPDGREEGGELAKWNYNSYNPKYNKNSYDLWIEYGHYGEDNNASTDDDFVKVISNWVN